MLPICRCGAEVVPPRRKYCSDACYQASELERKNALSRGRYHEDPEYRAKILARRKVQYEAKKRDPEKMKRRRAYEAAYRAQHREEIREYNREYRARLKQDPERYARYKARDAERMRQRRLEDPELYRERNRRDYYRVRNDPRQWRQRLAWQRMFYRLQIMQRGGTVTPVEGSREHDAMPFVPVGPLPGLVLRSVGDQDLESYCKSLGFDVRTLNDWRAGKRRFAQFDVVDRILLATDLNWWDVYEKPANGHVSGRPEDVLRYIDEAQVYIQACLAFEGELVE